MLRINNQNILPSRQIIYMSDISQRLRSSRSAEGNPDENSKRNNEQAALALQRQLRLSYRIPPSLQPTTHTIFCLKGHEIDCDRVQYFFSKKRINEAQFAIVDIIKSQFVCMNCLQIFFRIIDIRRPDIQQFDKLIKLCLVINHLPTEAKQKLEKIQQQILEEESKTNNNDIDEQDEQDDEQQNRHRYIQLYKKKGAKFQKVQIRQLSRDYRVAVAKQDIAPFENFIKIPEKQMITLQLVRQIPQIKKIIEEEGVLKSPKHCILAVFLILQKAKGKNSKYYHYFLSFPQTLETFPIYYMREELDYLEGTSFLSTLRRKKKQLKEDYKKIVKILPQIQQLTNFEEFVWARMIVSSRIFGISYNNNKTDALVPIADMLNHKSPKMTTWFYCQTQKAFIVQNCDQQIKKGEQIFDSYGSKCNSRFLLNYGFTMPDNPYNEVGVVLKKYKDSTITTGVKISSILSCDELKMMLSYYRYYAAHINDIDSSSQEESNIENKSTADKKKSKGFISRENQLEVWKLIKENIETRLSEYQTTVKEDQRILNKRYGNLTFNLRNCVEIRLGEKRVLHFYIQMANTMIEHFQKGTKIKNKTLYEEYLKDLEA